MACSISNTLVPPSRWAPENCEHHGHQSYRRRSFVQVEKYGGQPCEPNSLMQVQTCGRASHEAVDCVFGAWNAWSECENGQTMRSREIDSPAESRGSLCQGPLKEVKTCALGAEANRHVQKPCELSNWSQWSACADVLGSVQFRFRKAGATDSKMGIVV
ncbi:HMCN1 [Symbiodinium sp. CCMP2592]|nr:HMCN1 [Symbiodinium sp. CCMP2592]